MKKIIIIGIAISSIFLAGCSSALPSYNGGKTDSYNDCNVNGEIRRETTSYCNQIGGIVRY